MACRVIRGFVNSVKQNDRPEICGRNSNVIISKVLSLESVYPVAKALSTAGKLPGRKVDYLFPTSKSQPPPIESLHHTLIKHRDTVISIS
jgi:hypothetical protein